MYWFDGAYDASDSRHQGQQGYLNAIAGCAGIQLRLGHIRENVPEWHHALRKALEACNVDMAQDEGRRIVLLHPAKGGMATELRHLADEVRALTEEELGLMVRARN